MIWFSLRFLLNHVKTETSLGECSKANEHKIYNALMYFSTLLSILIHWHTFPTLSSYRFGRKTTFLMSCVLNTITGILVAVAPNYISLLVFRALYGFGSKGGWMVAFVLSKKANSSGKYQEDGVLYDFYYTAAALRNPR